MNGASVEFLPHPWVDGQLPDGVAVENVQQRRKFLRRMHSQPGLYGDGNGTLGKHVVQKPIEGFRVSQHPGTLALGGDRPGGAAQIEVDLVIAPVADDLRRPEKILRHFGQHLWDGGKAHTVRLRQFPAFPLGKLAVDGGGEEGHIISVNLGEIFAVKTAVNAVRQPLHGGKIIAHRRSPECTQMQNEALRGEKSP